MTVSNQQWIRRAGLQVIGALDAIDLSEMHFKFFIGQSDEETPNTATIRVYNLGPDTVKRVLMKEYSQVIVQAGYENGPFGVIFDGTIIQYRRGRENATDTYLDILASTGDIPYNFGTVSLSMAAGTPVDARLAAIGKQMGLPKIQTTVNGGVLPRGKVLWGMARTAVRQEAMTQGATWSIQNGNTLQMTPFKKYTKGEAVVISSSTGMIGIPEQTDQGISVRCLLNPKLVIGGLLRLNSNDINKTLQQNPSLGPIPYNQWAGIQYRARIIEGDGLYQAFVCEHQGDTRGNPWYSDIVCLAVDDTSGQIVANN